MDNTSLHSIIEVEGLRFTGACCGISGPFRFACFLQNARFTAENGILLDLRPPRVTRIIPLDTLTPLLGLLIRNQLIDKLVHTIIHGPDKSPKILLHTLSQNSNDLAKVAS